MSWFLLNHSYFNFLGSLLTFPLPSQLILQLKFSFNFQLQVSILIHVLAETGFAQIDSQPTIYDFSKFHSFVHFKFDKLFF